MKLWMFATAAIMLLPHGVFAGDTTDAFADDVQSRKGLMLLMSGNLAKLGAMAKGEMPYDAAAATKAAANVAALASVMSPDLFPAGSEYGKATDSYALPAIWANPDDFVARIAALNTAAAAMQVAAAGDAQGVQGGMAALGGACGACHKAYRQPEQ